MQPVRTLYQEDLENIIAMKNLQQLYIFIYIYIIYSFIIIINSIMDAKVKKKKK